MTVADTLPARVKPLKGLRVVSTRPRAQAAPLARRLADLGAEVVTTPLIKTVPPVSWAALDAALRRLASYDAAVFASANAVEAFFRRARTVNRVPPLAPHRVFAVGPATAKALAARLAACGGIPEPFDGRLGRRMGRVGRRV